MVKIKLIRGEHAGKSQAERLEPYIAQTDVVCVEYPQLDHAKKSEFEAMFTSAGGPLLASYMDREISATSRLGRYHRTQFQMIARHKKRVVQLEHTDEKTIERWDRIIHRLDDIFAAECAYFCSGKIEESIVLAYNGTRGLLALGTERDGCILNYLPQALKTVHQIAGEESRYTITIGTAHDIAAQIATVAQTEVDEVVLPPTPYRHLGPDVELMNALKREAASEMLRLACARHAAGSVIDLLFSDDMLSVDIARTSRHYAEFVNRNPDMDKADISEFVKAYVIDPISFGITGRMSMQQMRDFSQYLGASRMGLKEPEVAAQEITVFLRDNGIDFPRNATDVERMRNLVPSSTQPADPVVRRVMPK